MGSIEFITNAELTMLQCNNHMASLTDLIFLPGMDLAYSVPPSDFFRFGVFSKIAPLTSHSKQIRVLVLGASGLCLPQMDLIL